MKRRLPLRLSPEILEPLPVFCLSGESVKNKKSHMSLYIPDRGIQLFCNLYLFTTTYEIYVENAIT